MRRLWQWLWRHHDCAYCGLPRPARILMTTEPVRAIEGHEGGPLVRGHARELLKALMETENLVQLPEDGTQGQTAGLTAIAALEELEQLERQGWRFTPPEPVAE